MIKPGMWPVIVLGAMAALMRAFGPASFAEIAAIAYLSAATVAFGRPRLVSGHLFHAAPSFSSSGPSRTSTRRR